MAVPSAAEHRRDESTSGVTRGSGRRHSMVVTRTRIASIRARLRAVLVGVALVVSACSATSAPMSESTTVPPEDLTTTSLRTDPGGAVADTVGTQDTITRDTTTTTMASSPFTGGEASVLGPNGDGWNDNFPVPGPVIESDGTLYFFYTGHTYAAPNLQRGQVGYATSVDGVDWAFPDIEPLFDGSQLAWSGASVYPTSGMILDDGTWALWFSTVPRAFSIRGGSIGRATAPGPDGPWVVDPEPILEPGGEGTWFEKGVNVPSVVRTDDGFRMYFDGHGNDIDSEPDRAIGMMTSEDGETWVMYDDPSTGGILEGSDPVFAPGAPDTWDAARVMAPQVVEVPGGFVMVYLSSWRRADRPGFLQDVGYATSSDGITWRRADTNPLIGNRGTIAFITLSSVARIGDRIHVYYDIAGNAAGTSSFVVLRTADMEDLTIES
jgi:hypothetical protein